MHWARGVITVELSRHWAVLCLFELGKGVGQRLLRGADPRQVIAPFAARPLQELRCFSKLFVELCFSGLIAGQGSLQLLVLLFTLGNGVGVFVALSRAMVKLVLEFQDTGVALFLRDALLFRKLKERALGAPDAARQDSGSVPAGSVS